MNKLDIILRINKTITELEKIREELISEYPEYLHDMTMKQLLDGRASVRLLNAIYGVGYQDVPVLTFVKISRIDVLKFRGCGKLTMLELSRIIKEVTGIDW
jgi:hypothetical protein